MTGRGNVGEGVMGGADNDWVDNDGLSWDDKDGLGGVGNDGLGWVGNDEMGWVGNDGMGWFGSAMMGWLEEGVMVVGSYGWVESSTMIGWVGGDRFRIGVDVGWVGADAGLVVCGCIPEYGIGNHAAKEPNSEEVSICRRPCEMVLLGEAKGK